MISFRPLKKLMLLPLVFTTPLLGFETPLFTDKVHYNFTTDPIDVVIPCAARDRSTLSLCIKGIKENGKNIGRVFVISTRKWTDLAEWVDEQKFPFTKWDACLAMCGNDQTAAEEFSKHYNTHLSWIYQQLLKFYAFKIIPDISPNILILDADTIFLNPVEFTDPSGAPYFAVASENNEPYFLQMKRLIPWLKRETDYSGITHHMLLQKCVLDDFFEMVEKIHEMPTWQALATCIQNRYWASISEYEIYFNFIFARSDQAFIRNLDWRNSDSLRTINEYKAKGCHFVSCHRWMRKEG